MIPVIYSKHYDTSFQGHVFPVEKYKLLLDKITSSRPKDEYFICEAEKATNEQLLSVHTKEYLDDLENLRWDWRTVSSELPLTREIVDFFKYTAGSSILAAQKAQEYGAAFHAGGGFHHAFSDHGEGFCYINDIAAAVRHLQNQYGKSRFLVFDCDLHQGNGTAKIFENDDMVFTFSIHQENLYPVKQKSNMDIGLTDFADDEEYLLAEENAIENIFKDKNFHTVFYIAGADPFIEDKLGTLQISKEGLRKRDKLLLKACKEANANVVIMLAGGYALRTSDVVDIHYNTYLELINYQR